MNKVFVTGASGFVGSHLVERLAQEGFEVHAAVRKSSNIDQIAPFIKKFVYPNMADVSDLEKLFKEEQYHYVVHAAAMTKAKSDAEMFAVNVGYTENILDAAFSQLSSLQRLVYVSSLAAIGPVQLNADEPISEDTDYHPLTVYGRSKQASEEMIKRKFANKPISVFRPTAVYGPREKDLFILFETLNKGFDPYIGKSEQKLSFVFVSDLVDLLCQGMLVPQQNLAFYNVSDGQVYTKYAMADIFKKTFSKSAFRIHIPYGVVSLFAEISNFLYKTSTKTPVIYPERLKELTAENWSCNITKAKKELGFKPKYDLETGLKQTLIWYRTNKWL